MTFINPYTFIDELAFQHQRILQLFDRVLASDAEDRDEAFLALRRLLAVHEAAEEIIVHPKARAAIAAGGTVVEERLDEERAAKQLLAELEDMNLHSGEFEAKIEALRAAVERHAEREEREEFVALRNEIDDDEAARMADAVQAIESIAPTRPHPGVESASANLLVGPFAAMLDRARDAISARIRRGAH
ncbi:hemerythrin domain-containing protein [Tsukamurella ocularis]|uniref:hemerythrin domain-containing protein n=1 Tax=Tsukamurella ocularis TaxID=1970234 RepID=UPI0039F09F8F